MLETAIGDGTQKLSLEKEVAEARRVNANIAALLIRAISGNSQITLLSCGTVGCRGGSCGGGSRIGGLKLLVGVVDEILLVRHVENGWQKDAMEECR